MKRIIDLTGTGATEKGLQAILKNAPNLSRLDLKNTRISWSPQLVETLLKHSSLKKLEVDERSLDPVALKKLKTGLNSR